MTERLPLHLYNKGLRFTWINAHVNIVYWMFLQIFPCSFYMLFYAIFNGTIKNVYKSASEMATFDVLIFP